MKALERYNLIEKIARSLQSRMGFADIDIYMAAYGVDTDQISGEFSSKHTYAKAALRNVSDEAIIQMADELGIEHNHSIHTVHEATFWKPGYVKLFLSHLASFKAQASHLQSVLKKYGVSSFVAHEDIEPSKEWQQEIEAALHTMDALAALLMPGFKESHWCDQEVGVAVGRGALIIPVRKGLDPYGFIGKYQGIQGAGKTIGKVAEEIFLALARSPKTRSKMLQAVSGLITQATSVSEAKDALKILSEIEDLPSDLIENMKRQIIDNSILIADKSFIHLINKLFEKLGHSELVLTKLLEEEFDADIPF